MAVEWVVSAVSLMFSVVGSVTCTVLEIVAPVLPLPTLTMFVPPSRLIVSGVPMPGEVSPSTLAVSSPAPPTIVVLAMVALKVE